MSYEEAFGPAEAHYKMKVMHQTWGHLFPDKPEYIGVLRIGIPMYSGSGGPVILDEKDLPGASPWWYGAVTDFAYEHCKDYDTGMVVDLTIKVEVVDCEQELEDWEAKEYEEAGLEPDTWQEIEITELSQAIVAKGYSEENMEKK